MVVISGGISGSLGGSIGISRGNNNPTEYGIQNATVLPPIQQPATYIIDSPDYYPTNIHYPSIDSWNQAGNSSGNYITNSNYNYTNTTSPQYSVSNYPTKYESKENKTWNLALAIAGALFNNSTKQTGSRKSNEDLAHSVRTLVDTLKSNGSLSSGNLPNKPYSYNSHCNPNISQTNCYSPNTSSSSNTSLIISPNGNYSTDNLNYYTNNNGLTLVADNNYNSNAYHNNDDYYYDQTTMPVSTSNLNDIRISQGDNGTVIINLPTNLNVNNYDSANSSYNPYPNDNYDYLNHSNSNVIWPMNSQPNSTITIST